MQPSPTFTVPRRDLGAGQPRTAVAVGREGAVTASIHAYFSTATPAPNYDNVDASGRGRRRASDADQRRSLDRDGVVLRERAADGLAGALDVAIACGEPIGPGLNGELRLRAWSEFLVAEQAV